jgi:hypothetical protein
MAVLLLGLTSAVAGLVVVAMTEPRAGSTFGPGAVGLIATEEIDPAESDEPGAAYVYRYAPGATFLTMTSIRNDGLIALTLLGSEAPPVGIESTSLTWADRLLVSPWPEVIGPDDATPLHEVVVDAGQEIGVWIVWRVGSLCPPGERPPLQGGSGYGFDTLNLRWSIMGIPRSGTIELRHFVEVRNPADDQLVTCPG